MTTAIIECDCGRLVTKLFETSPKKGTSIGLQCKWCGRVLIGQVQGEGKYWRAQTVRIRNAILHVFLEMNPTLTVRQIFYALTVKDVVPKTERGYRQVCYHLAEMRRDGSLPYGWIADNTRWQIKPTTYTGLASALDIFQQAYRRDLWASQKTHVEMWVEKDAMAGVISPITQEYDVPLFVARGYGSMTFLYDAAEAIKSLGKPTYIYHLGDFDPSGVDAAYKVRDSLLEHGADVYFARIAVTPEQILLYDLPTRATKKSDPRAKNWGDLPSVELDAVPAPILRDLVRQYIEEHIDPDLLKRTREIEALERKTLAAVAEQATNGR